MKIYSDSVSEKYRKYIVKIKLSSSKSYYLLWGTDCTNLDFDYILLSLSNEILVFKKIADLLNYVRTTRKMVDKKNSKQWAREYRAMKSYCTYDLEKIRDFLLPEIEKTIKNRDNAFSIVDFINLFSDLAYQINEKRLIKIVREKNTRKYIDYTYAAFFWDNKGKGKSMKLEFDRTLFKVNVFQMITIFINRMQIS